MIMAGVPPRGWGRLEFLVGWVVSDEPTDQYSLSSVRRPKAYAGGPSSTGNPAGEQSVKRCRLGGSRGGTRQCENLRKAATQS